MKRKIPLDLLPKVNVLLSQYRHLIRPSEKAGTILYLKDNQWSSTILFQVEQLAEDRFAILRIPKSRFDTSQHSFHTDGEGLFNHLEGWLKLLEEYDQAQWVFDDPIQKKYADEFFQAFSMVDGDANYAPFEIPKILRLENYLEKVKTFIEDNSGEFTNTKDAERLINECKSLIENLPSTTKNQVLRKISSMWASIVKNSLPMMKKFFSTVGTEITKEIVKASVPEIGDAFKSIGENS